MEVIQHKETVNVNFSAAFFEGFVWHWNDENDDDFDEDDIAAVLLDVVFFFSFFVVKNRPRVKQTRNMEQKIFVMVVWMLLSLFVIVPFSKRFKLVFLSLGKSSLKFETNRRKRATMGVVLESDSEDDEKVLQRKKEESSDSEVFMFIYCSCSCSLSRCCCCCSERFVGGWFLNSIRFSLSFFLRFAAGLKEERHNSAAPL